jgi:hypothetical protein
MVVVALPEHETLHCKPGGQTATTPASDPVVDSHCPLLSQNAFLPQVELPCVQSAAHIEPLPQYSPAPQSAFVEQV